MAQVKLLKIHASTGVPQEFDSTADDITLLSFAVTGGGPVLSGTGLDLNNQDVSDVSDISFNDPAVGTIIGSNANNTIIANDLMGQAKENTMAVGAAILFPTVADAVNEVDAYRFPTIAGVPTAAPADASSGGGFALYDTTGKNLYLWDGALWDNIENSEAVENSYTAEEAIAARDCVYISSADSVSKADADDDTKSQAIGFAQLAALITAPVLIKTDGIVTGFTGLTAGARYFISSTAGAITATAPTASGRNVMQVGFAKSTTALQIRFQFYAKRA